VPDASQDVPPAVEPSKDVPVVPLKPLKPLEAVKKEKRYTGDRIAPARAYAIRALVDSGYSKKEICKREHVSINTVRAIQNSNRFDPARVDSIKQNLAAKWYQTADSAIDNIDATKLKQSSALQLATVAAISTDKARLIEGKATSRTEYMNVEDQAVNDEIARLEGELGAWERGDIVNTEGSEGERTTSAGLQAPETVDKGPNGAD